MKDNQNIYLNKVVEFLVRDTKMDYDKDKIQFPFYPFPCQFHKPPVTCDNPIRSSSFSKYCKNVYGLTDQEIEYVWVKYKSIIKDKITNR